MKYIFSIVTVFVVFTGCQVFKSRSTNRAGQPSPDNAKKESSPNVTYINNNTSATGDTVIITGTQYMPIEGRSETGTLVDLEGSWELESLNGTAIPGRSNLNVEMLTKKLPEGTEFRHDSTTTTQTVNGVTRTTTTVLVDKMGVSGNKITPPQGANYHIPARPSISFYGANETFSGFTGCNKFSGRYAVNGKDSINLRNTAASTKMVCLGDYDEEAFLSTLKRVNSFRATNGQLELMDGKTVLLVFSKKQS